MRKKLNTNGHVAELNKLVKSEYGSIPEKLKMLIYKTALDRAMLDNIAEELINSDLISIEIGSMGQQKQVVNPLVPYYDKLSSRLTDDLYNLGLTARKQAAKVDEKSSEAANPIAELLSTMQQR